MRLSIFFIWTTLTGAVLGSSLEAFSLTVFDGSQVKVAKGLPTLITFEQPVRTVLRAARFTIKPANSLKPDYAILSITPNKEAASENLVFVLADGTPIQLQVEVTDSAKSHPVYSVKTREDQEKLQGNSLLSFSALDLLKAIIRKNLISGVQVKTTRLRYVKKGLSITLVRTYESEEITGYVYRLKNLNKKKRVHIHINRLKLGAPSQALAAQIDRRALRPGQSTVLRVIGRPSSQANHLRLPMTYKKERR